jgi:hypothetical protein
MALHSQINSATGLFADVWLCKDEIISAMFIAGPFNIQENNTQSHFGCLLSKLGRNNFQIL